jgi:hypothetical protein
MKELLVGTVYEVNHCRKGRFQLRVTWQNEEWVKGVIVAGKAAAMCVHNERFEGEEVTIRRSFLSNIEEVK